MNAIQPHAYLSLMPHPEDASGAASQCRRMVRVTSWQHGAERDIDDEVAEECAVALTYNGLSHVVMMVTPSNLEELALGFSLSEGILATPDELYDIELCERAEGIEVAMSIATRRFVELKQRRRNLTGRTGCGLCGAESLQQAVRPVRPVAARPAPGPAAIQRAVGLLNRWQPLNAATGAVHGAAWCDAAGDIRLLREDVGRHNALDKLIGALHGGPYALHEGFALVTSRASYEMVQKASQVGIATLVAVSAPTSLAIRLAQQAGMNLIGFARPDRHVIYTRAGVDKAETTVGETDPHEA